MNRENMIINMGPHHPSTHGVLRLVVELDGETVVNVDPDLGYLHSGFEKTGENKRYKDFVYYTDRMDYLSGMNNNFGYVLAVEKLLGIEIPPRAQVIRVIMSELQRIASHLFWLSTHVLDVSGTGMSLLMYATTRTRAHPRPLRNGLRRSPDRQLHPRRRRLEGFAARLPDSPGRLCCASCRP